MIETGNYVRFERVSVGRRDRARAARPAARRAAADRPGPRRRGPGQDQPGRRRSTSRRRSRSASTRWPSRSTFTVERDGDVVRLRTAALVVSLGLDPFRLDVHRADGSAGRRDRGGRRRPLLGLRDAQRRVHGPPPVPPRGRDLRPGREVRAAQPQGPRLHAVEHRRARPGRDRASSPPAGARRPARGPDRAPSSTRTTSRSRSSTTRPTRPATMAASFVDNGYRGALRLLRARRVPHPLRRRPVHRVRLRRAGHAGDPRAPTPG